MISGPSNFVHLSHLGVDDFDDERALQSFNSFSILIQERNKNPEKFMRGSASENIQLGTTLKSVQEAQTVT